MDGVTAREFIQEHAAAIKKKLDKRTDLIIDYNLAALRIDTHIKIINNMGKLLNTYVADVPEKLEARKEYWLLVLKGMLVQCYLTERTPKCSYSVNYDSQYVNNHAVTAAESIQYRLEEDELLKFMESYLVMAVVDYEPLWWIELGNNLKITNIKIERDVS